MLLRTLFTPYLNESITMHFNSTITLKEQTEIAQLIRDHQLRFKDTEFFKQLSEKPEDRKKKYKDVVLDFNQVCHCFKEAMYYMDELVKLEAIGNDTTPYPSNRAVRFDTPFLSKYTKYPQFNALLDKINEQLQAVVDILKESFDTTLLTAILGYQAKGFVSDLKMRKEGSKTQILIMFTKTYKTKIANRWFDIPIRITM